MPVYVNLADLRHKKKAVLLRFMPNGYFPHQTIKDSENYGWNVETEGVFRDRIARVHEDFHKISYFGIKESIADWVDNMARAMEEFNADGQQVTIEHS